MKLAGLVLGVLIYTLVVLVVGVQLGLHQRIAPVTITSKPCVELRTQLCLVDSAGREVRVLDDGRLVYATPCPELPRADAVYIDPCTIHRNDWSAP